MLIVSKSAIATVTRPRARHTAGEDFCEATFRMSVAANICATRVLGCTLRRSRFGASQSLNIADQVNLGSRAL